MAAPGSTSHFFAYGTLRREAPMHALLSRSARFVCEARVRGRLWDLGAYPGVTDSRFRGDQVQGELYALAQEGRDALLDSLDRYEGEAFERAEREVVTTDGATCTAYLYLFLGSTRGVHRIESGDYVDDVRRAGPAARRV